MIGVARAVVQQPINVLFYGVGDKRALLDEFVGAVAALGVAAVVDLDLAQASPADTRLGGVLLRAAFSAVGVRGVPLKWSVLEAELGGLAPMASLRSGVLAPRVVLVVRAFCAAARFRGGVDALARFASLERVRVVAAVDDVVGACLAWTPAQRSRFAWTWVAHDTWAPYDEPSAELTRLISDHKQQRQQQ
jgi:hypothetical protein